ncbi:MAG: hypothetical protein ABH834_04210 [Candidatus Altiarchaeota archaeon]
MAGKDAWERRSSLFFVCFALASFLINASLFSASSHGDVRGQQEWGNYALKNGVASLYLRGVTDYPPIYLYVFELNSWISLTFFRTNALLSAPYVFVSKTIPTIALILTGLAVYLHFRDESRKKALLGSGLIMLNPALIYNTGYWGQVDSVNTLFMVLAVIFLARKRPLLSTLSISIAVLVKIQSLILAPLIWLIIVRERGVSASLKFAALNAVLVFLLLAPYVSSGVLGNVWSVVSGSVGYQPFVTANAYNIWFLASPRFPYQYLATLQDTTTVFGVTLRTISLVLMGAYTLFVLHRVLLKGVGATFAAASLCLAFFMLPTEIHERYLFAFIPLAAILVVEDLRHLKVFLLFTLTHLVNLMMAYPFKSSYNLLFYPLQSILDLIFSLDKQAFIGVACAVASVNIIAFIYFTRKGIADNE